MAAFSGVLVGYVLGVATIGVAILFVRCLKK